MSDMQRSKEELFLAFQDITFPNGFLDAYDQLECLAHSHGTETYLVKPRDAERLCIAKCYDRKVYTTINESNILKSIHHEGIPAFLDEYEDENTICVVREYIEGTPLHQWLLFGHSLTAQESAALCTKLCDLLSFLHKQKPPVIHRDLKPQNIVIKPDNSVALIDFDIARTYDGDAKTDTHFIGTRSYAPPEQYGFTQTDARADIYSMGVLLCFLLTGQTDVKNAEIADKRLAAIVQKCTAFSPEQRYQSADDVKRALLGTGESKRRRRAAAFALAAAVTLCAGVGVYIYGNRAAQPVAPQPVHFAEPLMEKAVRVQLGKDEAAVITREELLSVKTVCIFGGEVSVTKDAFVDGLAGWLADQPRGDIESLEDVALLPNLETLYVNYQQLEDISPVSQLEKLTEVNLRHTNVSDISALADMKSLKNLHLYDTNVSDLSCLAGCSEINNLEMGETLITSLDAIPAFERLEVLSLKWDRLASLDGIERFPRMERVFLEHTGIADLTPLYKLPRLIAIYLDETMRGTAETLVSPPFEIIFE